MVTWLLLALLAAPLVDGKPPGETTHRRLYHSGPRHLRSLRSSPSPKRMFPDEGSNPPPSTRAGEAEVELGLRVDSLRTRRSARVGSDVTRGLTALPQPTRSFPPPIDRLSTPRFSLLVDRQPTLDERQPARRTSLSLRFSGNGSSFLQSLTSSWRLAYILRRPCLQRERRPSLAITGRGLPKGHLAPRGGHGSDRKAESTAPPRRLPRTAGSDAGLSHSVKRRARALRAPPGERRREPGGLSRDASQDVHGGHVTGDSEQPRRVLGAGPAHPADSPGFENIPAPRGLQFGNVPAPRGLQSGDQTGFHRPPGLRGQGQTWSFADMSHAAAIFSNITRRGDGIPRLSRNRPDPVSAFFRHVGSHPVRSGAESTRTASPHVQHAAFTSANFLAGSDVKGPPGNVSAPSVASLYREVHFRGTGLKGDNSSRYESGGGGESWPLHGSEGAGGRRGGRARGLIACRGQGPVTRAQYQRAVQAVQTVTIPVLCVLGMAGNALVTWLAGPARMLPLCAHRCLLALLTANSGLLTCHLLRSVNLLVDQRYPLAGNHMTAHLYLPVYVYLGNAFASVSPLLLLLLALERLFANFRPLSRAHALTTRHAVQLAIFIYVISFALYLPRMFQMQFIQVQQENQTWYQETRTTWASGSYFREIYPMLQHVFRVWVPGLPLLLLSLAGSVLLVRARRRQVALRRLALHDGKASRRMRRLLGSLAAMVVLSVLYVGAVLPEVAAELLGATDEEFRLLGCRHYQRTLMAEVGALLLTLYAAAPLPVLLAASPRMRGALARRLGPAPCCRLA